MQNTVASAPCCCGASFFLAIGLALTAFGYKKYQLVQKIENTPTSKIRSVAVGLVEINGKARIRETFESPISKAKCAYWYVTAQYHHHSKNHDEWRTFYTAGSSAPFYIEDDTGKMLVDPKDGQVNIRIDFSSQGHLSGKAFFGLLPQQQLDQKVLAFLETNPSVKSQFQAHAGSTIRVYEYYIEDGDVLYALGTAEPLEGAKSEVHQENLVLRKGKDEQTLFISDSSEAKVVGGNKLESMIYLFIGLVLSAAALLVVVFSIFTILMAL